MTIRVPTPPRASTSNFLLIMFRSHMYKKVVIIEAKITKDTA